MVVIIAELHVVDGVPVHLIEIWHLCS
jgi:hypothetical protein